MGALIPFLLRFAPALIGTGESAGILGALTGAAGGGEAAALAQQAGTADAARKAFDFDSAIEALKTQVAEEGKDSMKRLGGFVGPLAEQELDHYGYRVPAPAGTASTAPAPGTATPATPLAPPVTPPTSPARPAPASPGPLITPASPPPRVRPVPLPPQLLPQFPGAPTTPPPQLPPAPPGSAGSPDNPYLDKFADFLKKAPVGLTALLAALHTAQQGLEGFAREIVDGNRHLGQWNGNIASSFAESRFREQQREMDLADNTEGSVTALNESFQDLLDETHEIRETGARLLNTVGIVAANLSKILAIAIKLSPHFTITEWLLKQIEEHLKGNGPNGDLFDEFADAAMGRRPQQQAPGQPPAAAPAPQRPKWVDPMGQQKAADRVRGILGGN